MESMAFLDRGAKPLRGGGQGMRHRHRAHWPMSGGAAWRRLLPRRGHDPARPETDGPGRLSRWRLRCKEPGGLQLRLSTPGAPARQIPANH